MSAALLVPALLCLLPVLGFLALLLFLDSYELVPLRMVAVLLIAGIVMAVVGYFVNDRALQLMRIDLQSYSRYVAPIVEEALKGAFVVWLIRRHRIGFLVDAAIVGFAIGCGFALVENLYALWRIPDAGAATWLVRGFGTAIMHGGATAAFALISLAILERDERQGLVALLPGFVLAVVLHSAFNHLNHEPTLATCAVLVAVPVSLFLAYQRGERALGDWLGRGFDADTDLLRLMQSGQLAASPTGRYLEALKTRFHGAAVADLLCYLRLFTELSLRAKGMLLMRENGFEPETDDATRANFAELTYLEASIGVAGLLALHPLLPMRRKALRQLYLL